MERPYIHSCVQTTLSNQVATVCNSSATPKARPLIGRCDLRRLCSTTYAVPWLLRGFVRNTALVSLTNILSHPTRRSVLRGGGMIRMMTHVKPIIDAAQFRVTVCTSLCEFHGTSRDCVCPPTSHQPLSTSSVRTHLRLHGHGAEAEARRRSVASWQHSGRMSGPSWFFLCRDVSVWKTRKAHSLLTCCVGTWLPPPCITSISAQHEARTSPQVRRL
jgi:hypothetical protein